MSEGRHGATHPERDYWLQACILLAACKHHPNAVSLPEIQATIREFSAEDVVRAERVAARLADEATHV